MNEEPKGPSRLFSNYMQVCGMVTESEEAGEYDERIWKRIQQDIHDEVEECVERGFITGEQAAILVNTYPTIFPSAVSENQTSPEQ